MLSKGIHSKAGKMHEAAPRSLDQMLAVMAFSQHRVSSSKTVRQKIFVGARCVGHVKIIWSAVCSAAPHSQFDVGARPYLCMDD